MSKHLVRLDALAYALALADLLAIALWTWDFNAPREAAVFQTDRAYFAFGGVIVLLGCVGVAVLLRAGRRHKRRASMISLRVSSALLLLPMAGYGLIVWAAHALSSMP